MQPKVLLQVAMFEDGRVVVNGPLHDRLLCYGMLEMARDVVRDWRPPAVATPTPEQARLLVPGG